MKEEVKIGGGHSRWRGTFSSRLRVFSVSSPVRWGQHDLPRTDPVTVRNKICRYTLSMLNRESCYHFRGDQNPPHDAHGSPMIREAFAWALTSLLPHFHQPTALSCLVSRDSPLLSCPQSQPQSFSGSWVTRMDLGGAGGWAWVSPRKQSLPLLKLHSPLGTHVGGSGTHTVYPPHRPITGPSTQ